MTTVNERRQGIGERHRLSLVYILAIEYISSTMIKSDGVASIWVSYAVASNSQEKYTNIT